MGTWRSHTFYCESFCVTSIDGQNRCSHSAYGKGLEKSERNDVGLWGNRSDKTHLICIEGCEWLAKTKQWALGPVTPGHAMAAVYKS